MERKPYYILRMFDSNFTLREGTVREVYKSSGHALQLYLSDEEVQKYSPEVVKEILRPYSEVTLKRYKDIPVELIFYAISEVLYEDNKA